MTKYVVSGWKAGARYEKVAGSLAGAQGCADEAKDKGFMDIKIKGDDGANFEPGELDHLLGEKS